MTALPSHRRLEPAAAVPTGGYHAPDDVLPCGTLTGVILLAMSAASVRFAAFLTLEGGPLTDSDRLVGAGATALTGIFGTLLSYAIARRVTRSGRESASQLAGLTAGALAAFWPTQGWLGAPHGPEVVGVECLKTCLEQPGPALLAAAAASLAGPSILARIALAASLAWATTLQPLFAVLFPIAALVTAFNGGSLWQRLGGLFVLGGAAAAWVWLSGFRVDLGALPSLVERATFWTIQPIDPQDASAMAVTAVFGMALLLALLGVLPSARRQRPTLFGTALVLIALTYVAITAGDPGRTWATAVEPLLLPSAALFVAGRLGRWALPRERPLLVQRYLSTHRTGRVGSHHDYGHD